MHGTVALFRVARPKRVPRRCLSAISGRALSSAIADNAVKPYYITTPIFYPNAVPHIGHLHSLVVADIFARYARFSDPNRPVRFMTGTDEHGLKIQKAAEARGMPPLAFCDELSQHFRALAKKADISNTDFARTTTAQHHEAVQHLWRELYSKGLIYKGRHQGWYSVSDECFYTDLQVTAVDPAPGSSASDERYYVSTETGSRVEWQEEENYMFRLSAFRERLHDLYAADEGRILPPPQQADVLALLSEPLDDLSVSRPAARLGWGIPVPGDPAHTIYVWIDALTVYLSTLGYPWAGTGAVDGWPPDVQVIGKDIVRFHAVYLPAMLQALDLPLARRLLAHAHWTVDRHKMSKSVGNVADPMQALDEFGVDVVRYYLARVGGRFRDDTDWSRTQLEKHARELTASLGNLLARSASPKMLARAAGPAVVDLTAHMTAHMPAAPLLARLRALPAAVRSDMDALQLADALERIVGVLQEANALMTRTAIWADTTPPTSARAVLALVLECLRVAALLLQPVVPHSAARALDALGVPAAQRGLVHAAAVGAADVRVDAGNVCGVLLFPKRTGGARAVAEAGL